MKELQVPIDNAGRVVLPRVIREELAIDPGDMLAVSVRGNEVTLRPKKEQAGFIRRKKALVFSTGTQQVLEPEMAAAALDEIRGEGVSRTAVRLALRKRRFAP